MAHRDGVETSDKKFVETATSRVDLAASLISSVSLARSRCYRTRIHVVRTQA